MGDSSEWIAASLGLEYLSRKCRAEWQTCG